MNINNFLVRLKGLDKNKKEHFISSYYTENITETLKLFTFMKEHDIPVQTHNDFIIDNFMDDKFFISDINYHFGGDEYMPCLDIWVEL